MAKSYGAVLTSKHRVQSRLSYYAPALAAPSHRHRIDVIPVVPILENKCAQVAKRASTISTALTYLQPVVH